MNPSHARLRNIELGRIHKAASDLGLRRPGDDSAYRDMLWAVARVRSAADLDAGGRKAVLDHLQAVGWKFSSKPSPGRSRMRGSAGFMQMLWIRLFQAGAIKDGSDAALRAYVRNQTAGYTGTGVGYDSPELLPADVARKVIEQMKQWAARCGVEW